MKALQLVLMLCLSVGAGSLSLGAVPQGSEVELGVDRLVAGGFYEIKGKRVGLVTNPSGVDGKGRATCEILHKAKEVNLVALFGPEHGFDGKTPAGEYVKSFRDARTGLMVHSLYGSTRRPTPEMLKGLDCIVYDMQDIGCRSYTYISTLGYVMEEAQKEGIEVVVLDRPNPLGGGRVEGPRLDPDYRSFVGLYDMPYVYGLTVGELALWVNEHYLPERCNLTVVPMHGWKRSMTWEQTGLKWVPTSPNIPTVRAAIGYVATGLLGEIGVTNGANDRYPFELITSENLKGEWMAQEMRKAGFEGVKFEPFGYHPGSGKYQHILFTGVRLEVDPHASANLTSIPFYAYPLLHETFPRRDYFRKRKGEKIRMFDKINGSNKPREALQKGVAPSKIVAEWEEGVRKWKYEREPYLLYR